MPIVSTNYIDYMKKRLITETADACVTRIGDRIEPFHAFYGKKSLPVMEEDLLAGKSPYHFIEVMACPGGCACGGGSPIRGDGDTRKEGIYKSDESSKVRKSHENKEVQDLYKNYLLKPNSEKSHHLLHT